MQLALEQYGLELQRSNYSLISFNKHIGKCFGDLQQFEKLTDKPHGIEILKRFLIS